VRQGRAQGRSAHLVRESWRDRMLVDRVAPLFHFADLADEAWSRRSMRSGFSTVRRRVAKRAVTENGRVVLYDSCTRAKGILPRQARRPRETRSWYGNATIRLRHNTRELSGCVWCEARYFER
jgi:hypothetical protein